VEYTIRQQPIYYTSFHYTSGNCDTYMLTFMQHEDMYISSQNSQYNKTSGQTIMTTGRIAAAFFVGKI